MNFISSQIKTSKQLFIALFFLTLATSANNKANFNSCFIDSSIEQQESLLSSLDAEQHVFHLFSHGRSGELLINGKWKNAKQIAEFLNSTFNIQNSTILDLNIYGCEFAKGEKGKRAVAYLENALNLKVNASTNITGVSGDWILEVGAKSIANLSNYKYNLQTGPTDDYDGDSISNTLDLDDDNDGILDKNDCNFSVFYGGTATQSSNYINNSKANLARDGNISGVFNEGSVSHTAQEANPWWLLDLGSTQKVQYIEIYNRTDCCGGRLDDFILEVLDASNSVVYTYTHGTATAINSISNINTNGNKVRIRLAGSNKILSLAEVKIFTGDCEDTDSDGIENNFDLDSDGDGCSDAIEGSGFVVNNQLATSSLPGGNTGGSFSGVSGVGGVQDNLGNTVNTIAGSLFYGVPTVVVTGQNRGASQDKNNTTACTDTDGDNINDYVDLDDDNDGILDLDEGYCNAEEIDLEFGTNTVTKTTFQLSSVTDYTQHQTNRGQISPSAPKVFLNGFDTEGGAGVFTNIFDSPKQLQVDSNGNISLIIHFYGNISNSTGTYRTDPLDFNLLTSTGTLNGQFTISSADATILDNGGWVTYTVNYTVPPNSIVELTGVSGQIESNSQGTFSNFRPNASEVNAISLGKLSGCSQTLDTDNDGIPNHLDLDSDGDGCPDAIEGSALFVNNQLVTSNLPGGNSAGDAAYAGGNGPVVSNLGNTVDANGIPTIAEGGQNIGASQNADSATECTDSDGDGINDYVDLDDDNDGILDLDEKDCVESPFLNNPSNCSTGLFDYYGIPGNTNAENIPKEAGFTVFQANGSDATKTGDVTIVSVCGYRSFSPYNTPLVIQGVNPKTGAPAEIESINLIADCAGNNEIPWVEYYDASGNIIGSTLNDVNPNMTQNECRTFVMPPGTFYFRFGNTNSTATIGNISIDAADICEDLDTDNDGIPNHLDLDSDGDGCPDAIEGAGAYDSTNLVDSTMPGGSTNIIQNLGAASNTDGTPNLDNNVNNSESQGFGNAHTYGRDTECCSDAANYPNVKDSDGDGLGDDCDLDDDNDGILDTDECVIVSDNDIRYFLYQNISESHQANAVNSTYISSTQPWVDGTGLMTTTTSYIAVRDVSATTLSEAVTNNEYIEYEFTTASFYNYFTEWSVYTSTENSNTYTWSLVISDDNFATSTTILSDENFQPNVGTYKADLSMNYLAEPNTTYKMRAYFYNVTGGSAATFAHDDMAIYGYTLCDADNDGIPNTLDLDSDGDGCPDAIEGAGTYDSTNLVDSTMPGGSTNVQQNLGDVSNTDGTPNLDSDTATSESQAVGDAHTYGSTTECCSDATNYPAITDSDGDGLGDDCDLDDDNDGILDLDENCVATSQAVHDGTIPFMSDETPSGTTVAVSTQQTDANVSIVGNYSPPRSFVINGQQRVEYASAVQINPDATTNETIITYTFSNPILASEVGLMLEDFDRGNPTGKISVSGGTATTADFSVQSILRNGESSESPAINYNGGTGEFSFPTAPASTNRYASLISGHGTNTLTQLQLTVTNLGNVGAQSASGGDNVRIFLVPLVDCNNDIDSDGIQNSLDLDSDGDGCPDAIEGAGSFTAEDLSTSTMPGGNTAGDPAYTGGNDPVQDNLTGSPVATGAVGSTGIPTGVDQTNGQGSGGSQTIGDITITTQPENEGICENEIPGTVTFNASATGTPAVGLSWQWEMMTQGDTDFSPVTGGSGTGTDASLVVNVNDANQNNTIYRVSYTSDAMGCSVYSEEAYLIIHTLPVVDIIERGFCLQDNPGQILASPAGGTFGGGTYISSTGVFDPQAAGIGSHTITYDYTDVNGCKVDQVTTTITVSNNPEVTAVSNPTCINSGIQTLQVSPAGGTFSGPGVNATTGVFDPQVAGIGSHTVYYSVQDSSGSGCSGSNTLNLIVKGEPAIQIPEYGPYCLNDASVQLAATPSGGTYTGTGVNASGVFNPATAGVGTHTITYTIEESTATCGGAKTTTIEVLNSSQLVATPLTQTICSGATANIAITGDNGATVNWTTDTGLSGTGTSISEVLVNNGTVNKTTVFTINTKIGDCLDTTEATVIVKPYPAVLAPQKAVICDFQTLDISLASPLSGTVINWTLKDNSGAVVASGTGTDTAAINQSGLASGNYTLEYTGTNSSCTSETYTIPVTVN